MTKTNVNHRALAVMATHGMEDFLENSLSSAARCGFDMRHVHVFHSDDMSAAADRHVERLGLRSHAFELGAVASQVTGYRLYGTPGFGDLMLQKYLIFERLFAEYDVVAYADLDLVWLRNPWPYFDRVMTHYDMAIQTEALATFPPTYCMGLVVAKDTRWSRVTLDLVQKKLSDTRATDANASDQATFNALIAKEPESWSKIFPLPEGIFPNGLLTSLFMHANPETEIMAGVLAPIAYHANWTIGTDNKRRLLANAGLWNMSGS